MTVTETRTEEAAPAATESPARPAPTGLAGLLGTGDHRTIGKLYIATSMLFLVVAGVAGGAVGIERADVSKIDVFDRATDALQVFTLHSVAAVFLFLLPCTLGVAFLVVPRQVGASTVAFPRAAAASYWMFLVTGGLVIASYAINGGPFGGDADGVDLFLIAFGAVLVTLLLATVCVVTTALAVRTAGMSLDRVPMFSWAMVVAGGMWLLTLPVLVANVVLLYVDHHYGRVLFGGNAGMYGHLVWAFRQPQIYAFAVPALGVIGDVIPVLSRTPQRHRGIVQGAIGAVGVLGFGAWAQPALAPRASEQALWVGMAFAVVLPVLVLAGLWADTLRRGSVRIASPLLLSFAALLVLLLGVVVGALGSIGKLDFRIEEGVLTTWDAGHAHLVLLAATIGTIAAIHYWAPVIWRRPLKDGLGMATALLLLGGSILLAVPDLFSAMLDQGGFLQGTARIRDGVETYNVLSVIGGGLLLVGVLAFLANIVTSLTPGKDESTDPWEGHTLEWAAGERPEVTSATPVLDARAGGA